MNAYPDHNLFAFRTLRPDRPSTASIPCAMPGQVAVHLAVCIQDFPLTAKPQFAVPGMLDRPFPDLSNWTQRKTALREGLARLEDLFDELAIPVSLVVESEALDELRPFERLLRNDQHSVVAGGAHAAALQSAFADREAEARAVAGVLERLHDALGFPVDAWRSPSGVHSPHTLEVLAASGVRTVLDLNNDELPFVLETASGSLLALPWQHFSSDLHCLHVCKQRLEDYLHDLTQGVRWLKAEAAQTETRIMTLPIHPWIMAAPHRFRAFGAMLREWSSMPGLNFVNAGRIVAG